MECSINHGGPFAEGRNNLFRNEVLSSIAKKHNKSVAQVVFRWLIQHKVVAIPKSVHKERIIENMDIFDFELNEDDLELISTLDTRESLFLDYHDPEIAKSLGTLRVDL